MPSLIMVREIAWVRAAKKDFQKFPEAVQRRVVRALRIAAQGELAEISKPIKGLDPGLFEVRVAYRSDAFRTIYAVKLGQALYVLHAFQKKSKQGISTPKQEMDVVRSRLRHLKDLLR